MAVVSSLNSVVTPVIVFVALMEWKYFPDSVLGEKVILPITVRSLKNSSVQEGPRHFDSFNSFDYEFLKDARCVALGRY